MSGKLDRSLDDIMGSRRQAGRRAGRRPRVVKAATVAPVGGISKAGRGSRPKSQIAQAVTPLSTAARDGKILVSGLVCSEFSRMLFSKLTHLTAV